MSKVEQRTVSEGRHRSSAPFGKSLGFYLILIVASIPFVGPLLWMLSSSVKPDVEVFAYPPSFFPSEWMWENYARVFEIQPYALQYWNSIYIAVLVTVATVLISTVAGYAFARLRFRGAGALFLLLLTGMFIPEEVVIVPLYQVVSSLGLIDSHLPLIIIPIFSAGSVIGTFVMRQAFLSLPKEVEEAARIDGLGFFKTFWRISLPLVSPSLVVVVILAFWSTWNMYLEPLVFLRSPQNYTLPVALTQFVDQYSQLPYWNITMAAATLATVPIIVVFLFAQRYVIAGMTSGAVKG